MINQSLETTSSTFEYQDGDDLENVRRDIGTVLEGQSQILRQKESRTVYLSIFEGNVTISNIVLNTLNDDQNEGKEKPFCLTIQGDFEEESVDLSFWKNAKGLRRVEIGDIVGPVEGVHLETLKNSLGTLEDQALAQKILDDFMIN